ncbi:autotransporter-associated beta strand repeat-containing protein [Planctomycetota bacterium]|nr:autotransporter-associated beta strand repeat-containing protein [Planctomycetota bacterium]
MKAPLQTSSLLPAAMALITIGTVGFTASPASATICAWDGSENSLWGTENNWKYVNASNVLVDGIVPDSNDIVTFNDLQSPQTTYVELDGSRVVDELWFEGATGYTLTDSTSLDTLTISSGNITTIGSATHHIWNTINLGGEGTWNIGEESALRVYSTINFNHKLTKTGTGTLTFTGGNVDDPSSVDSLVSSEGHLILDGAYINVTFGNPFPATGGVKANGGDITLKNGTQVAMNQFGGVKNGTLILTGNGTKLSGRGLDVAESNNSTGSVVVKDGAKLDISSLMYIAYAGDADLTVQNGGTVSTGIVTAGVLESASGSILVDGNNSTLTAGGMNLGGQTSAQSKGTGTLTVQNGGKVTSEDITHVWSTTSNITLDGGTFETNRLFGKGTINISGGDNALTVGINNGSSTFDGLFKDISDPIHDVGYEFGRITKAGTGTFTLTGGTDDDPSEIGILSSEDGEVILDGAHVNLKSIYSNTKSALYANGGNVTLQNGADVELHPLSGYAWVQDGALSITGEGSQLSAYTTYLHNNGSLVVDAGGALQTARLTGNGTVNISGDDALTVGLYNNSSTFHGTITGTGTLTKTGSGVFALTGGSANNPSNFGYLSSEGGSVTLDGANVNLTGSSYSLTLDGGNVTLRGGSGVQLSSTQITDGALTITGSGTSMNGTSLVLLDENGSLVVEDQAALDLTGGLQIGLIGTGNLAVQSGAAVSADNVNIAGSDAGLVTGSGSKLSANWLHISTYDGNSRILTVSDGATVEVADTTYLSYDGIALNIDSGTLKTDKLNSDLNTLKQPTINLSGNSELIVGINNGDSIYKGVIQDDASGLSTFTKTGTGTFTLSGDYIDAPSSIGRLVATDGTVILDEVHVNLTGTAFDAQSALSADGGDITLQNGAVVQLNNTSGAAWVNGSAVTVTGNGTSLNAGLGMTVQNNNGNTGSLIVKDGAALDLTYLSIGDDESGEMTVESGATVSVDYATFTNSSTGSVTGSQLSAKELTLRDASALTVNNGSTVEIADVTNVWSSADNSLTIDDSTLRTNRLNGSGTVSISGNDALTVGINNGSSTFYGQIQDAAGGAGSLTKTGSGTFTLTGNNTYTGNTFVTDGTLLASNTTGSATGSGEVAVFDGGTLGGNGMIASKVFINDGGTLAPGESAGHLTVNDVVFGMGSTFEVELGGLEASTEYDVLSVLGYAILDNGPLLEVSLIDGFELDFGQHFEIVNVGDRLIGGFNSLVEGARVSSFNDIDLFITYQAGDGNDIALYTTAIPEPASFVLLGLGGLTFILREKRCTPERRSA